MKHRIFESINMDSDEKTDGQGFVLVGDPKPETEETKQAEQTTRSNESAKDTPPVTEKMTDSDDQFFSQFNSGGGNDQVPPRMRDGNSSGNGGNKKKSGRNIMIIILALIVGLGGGFGGGAIAVNVLGGGGSGSNYTIDANTEDLNVTEAVAQKVLPSTVGITATTTQVTENMFFGAQEQEVSGVGTGIIVDKAGYILTNSHVIMDDDQTKLKVLLSDGREVDGTVKWFDAGLDLAIVKINADNLVAAELGDSGNLKVGQYVAAIGNPLGLEFQGTVTQGVVSGLDRTIVATSDNKEVSMENLIQVDAAINSGNSGGPLLDDQGKVIGINTAKAESGENMGFAIPIDAAKPIVDSIKESGDYSRAYMGVTVGNVATAIEQNPSANFGTKTGAYIDTVTKGSPAEAAGLQKGDVIVEVDGNKIETRSDLINLLLKYKSGDTINVKYYRDGNVNTTNVKLTNDVQE